jgi:hypothetical protein|tara:strand:+ start:663 stop:824 length:162 start_codon:yes stop_codon:yes gene_type:complete
MAVLRSRKTTNKKELFFSNTIQIHFYYLSKEEKQDKLKTYKKIVRKNKILNLF